MDFDFMQAMTQPDPDPAPVADSAMDAPEVDPVGTVDETDVPPESEPQAPAETENHKQVQTQQDNAGFAAARRRAEAEWKAKEQAADAFRARMDALAKARGFANIDELEQAVNAEAEAQKAAAYKEKYGIDPNAVKPLVEDAVNNHPAVMAAKRAEAQAKIEAGRKALNDAVAEIGKLDNRIKTLEDLPKMDNYEQFDRMVRQQGYKMIDAYKLCNMDRLQERRAAAVRQETKNSINGRSHLKQTGGDSGGTANVVPADVMAAYRAIIPGATDAEIRKHWAANNKT